MRRACTAWERFWFAQEPASTLALVRIAFAAVTLVWAATLVPDLGAFYGTGGPVEGSGAAGTVLALLFVAAGCLLVGYHSRIAAIAVPACLVWFDRVDGTVLNGGDALLRDIGLFLALAPLGAALSVDRWRRSRASFWDCPRRSVWPLRLVQVQVSVMYLASVVWKLSGSTWRDGTAVSYPLRIPGIARDPLPDSVAASPALVHVLTWGTLGAELAIGLLVWSRRARPWALAAGVLLHLSIEATLEPGFFSWAVLVGYVAFIPTERATLLVKAAERRLTRRRAGITALAQSSTSGRSRSAPGPPSTL
jgi:hypothetical protein